MPCAATEFQSLTTTDRSSLRPDTVSTLAVLSEFAWPILHDQDPYRELSLHRTGRGPADVAADFAVPTYLPVKIRIATVLLQRMYSKKFPERALQVWPTPRIFVNCAFRNCS